MSELLAPGGALAAAIPDYEDRPEQREMSAAVAAALDVGRSLIVEAGTGTGKTFAYLVPALQSGKRVIISTGTRTLQEQIARQDVPRLEAIVDRPFRAVTLKGVSNYLCQRKLAEVARADVLDRAEADVDLYTLLAWARDTATGDRAELPGVPDQAPIWAQVTTGPETRLGPRCPYFERCFVTRARRAAEDADLVLVNHHLFFADLALRTAYPGARVLPDYDAVIFDEAHQLEDVITEHFGMTVSTLRLGHWLREAEHVLGGDLFDAAPSSGLLTAVRIHGEAFFAQIARVLRGLAADAERVEVPAETFSRREVHQAWLAFDTALDEAGGHLEARADREGDQAMGPGADPERAEDLRAVARRANRMRDDLAALAEGDAAGMVHWGEARGGAVSLRASPIDVGEIVRRHVSGPDGSTPAVFTSATLTTEASFRYFRDRIGLEEDQADELALLSPFDYAHQALLYAARDLPDPREPGFGAASAERIAALLEITAGRAFVLFTSHRALDEIGSRLAALTRYPLLIQGRQSRAGLIDQFRATPSAVLLATGGFWEGVDVPGEALSHVIIDKLPFAPPADPLVAARMRRVAERGGEPFAEYQLPQAALALKQGIGRLIRRKDDRGLISILDGRLVTRRYGRAFFASLPPELQRTSSIERARRWWVGA